MEGCSDTLSCQRLKDDWFVIMDGSDDPYIVHENEIEECIGELREGIVDTVCQDLQDSLLKRHSINSMVDAVIREYKDSPKLKDSCYWVTVYHVNSDVICKYNDYAKREGMPLIDRINPTEEQVHDAICSVAKVNLLHFLKKEKCEFKSYYTPALALMGGMNGFVESLIEVIE